MNTEKTVKAIAMTVAGGWWSKPDSWMELSEEQFKFFKERGRISTLASVEEGEATVRLYEAFVAGFIVEINGAWFWAQGLDLGRGELVLDYVYTLKQEVTEDEFLGWLFPEYDLVETDDGWLVRKGEESVAVWLGSHLYGESDAYYWIGEICKGEHRDEIVRRLSLPTGTTIFKIWFDGTVAAIEA